MKIGLVALEIGRKVGGLEVYETNLIRALARVDLQNEYEVFCLDPVVPEILGLRTPNVQFHVLQAGRFKGVLWDLPRALAKAKLDLFHALFVPPPFTSVPYVFTHHGSEVIERSDFYPFGLGLRIQVLVRRAFQKAGLILCVSNYVRNYLAGVRGIPEAKLRTVYHGCRPEFRPIDQAVAREFVARKYALDRPFLLVVGRIEPRKNPIRVLQAYDRFRRSVQDAPQLVFAGMKTWSAREFDRTVREFGLHHAVVQLGYVPDDDLPMLYPASEFAVYASLWEGFGLPVLEAFATGTPLMTSRTTSLPEVSDGACLMVDPYSIDDIASAMRALHEDRALRVQLVRRGQARAATFSWERAARETLSAYSALAAGSVIRAGGAN